MGAICLWVVVWGTSFAHQAGGDWVGWIPRTSPTSFARAVSGQITDVEPLAWVVLAAVLAGGWCSGERTAGSRTCGSRWERCPSLLPQLIGLRVAVPHRSRGHGSVLGAAARARATLAAALAARWPLPGRAVTLALVAVVAIGTVTFLGGKRYDADLAIDHLDAVVRPGDVIVTRPARYATLPAYRIGVEQWRDIRWVATPGIDSAVGVPSGDVAPTGRIWLFTPDVVRAALPGLSEFRVDRRGSRAPWSDGLTHVVCLETTALSVGQRRNCGSDQSQSRAWSNPMSVGCQFHSIDEGASEPRAWIAMLSTSAVATTAPRSTRRWLAIRAKTGGRNHTTKGAMSVSQRGPYAQPAHHSGTVETTSQYPTALAATARSSERRSPSRRLTMNP